MLAPDNAEYRQRLEALNAIAKRLGGHVEFTLVDQALPIDEIARLSQGAVALHPGGMGIRRFNPGQVTELVKKVPGIKLLQTPSAGTDFYDKAALARLGVKVADNHGANAVAVAEHAIALMVVAYRKMNMQFATIQAGGWQGPIIKHPIEEFHTLVGKRVGIVGLGRIGSRVAKRLQGWECEVVYHDILDFPPEYEQAAYAARVDFDTLLKTSDLVSLHVPLDSTTRRMVSERELGLMKPSAILVNTCRGPVVDEKALVQALRAKRIFGAALDVVETEPIEKDNPLIGMENVVLTPHLATRAIESIRNANNFIVENITRAALGQEIQSVAQPV